MVVVVELFFLEREALKRAVVDGSVHGLSVGGVGHASGCRLTSNRKPNSSLNAMRSFKETSMDMSSSSTSSFSPPSDLLPSGEAPKPTSLCSIRGEQTRRTNIGAATQKGHRFGHHLHS